MGTKRMSVAMLPRDLDKAITNGSHFCATKPFSHFDEVIKFSEASFTARFQVHYISNNFFSPNDFSCQQFLPKHGFVRIN